MPARNIVSLAAAGSPSFMEPERQAEHLARLRLQPDQPKDFHVEARRAQDGGSEVELHLYDVLGWPFIEARDVINAVPRDATSIVLRINSPGGVIYEGMAIYNFLRSHPARVEVLVDGLAASSASLVAMAGNAIRVADASYLMVHHPWCCMCGNAEDLRQEAEVLEKDSRMFAKVYAERAGVSVEDALAWMDAETWFSGSEAVNAGLADELFNEGSAATAMARFDLSIFSNIPAGFGPGRKAAAARPGEAPKQPQQEDVEMDPELRAFLESLGLRKGASNKEALAFVRKAIDKATASEADKAQLEEAAKALADGMAEEAVEQAKAEAHKQAVAEERARVAAINQAVADAGLDREYADELVAGGVEVDKAREKIIARLSEARQPLGGRLPDITVDEADKFRSAAADGICLRMGVTPDKPAPGHEQFRAVSISRMARLCLRRAGVPGVDTMSRAQVADIIIGKRMAGAAVSTSDFSSVFLDVARKRLLKAFTEYPATWRPIVNIVPADDFKTIYGVKLSEGGDLAEVKENGEYKQSYLTDSRESYAVAKYGRIVSLTWEMIVNDDLKAFGKVPRLLGAAAARKNADVVYALITSNPTMNEDSTALFHADHSNLEATSGDIGAVDSDNLDAARAAMRLQTGMDGATLDLEPAFLLVPVEQEVSAAVLLRSMANPEDNKNAGVFNFWSGRLTPIADPRLSANSALAWYLVADPSQVDTIDVSFLDGQEQPYIVEHEEFVRDAIGWKCRHCVGAGVMEYRGFFKNPGE